MKRVVFLIFFLFCALGLWQVALANEDPSFGLIYVEANTGGASGGHLAVRVGPQVFHFQQHEDGFFRLERTPWPKFLHIYNDIENRPLYFARTRIGKDKLERLEGHFLRLLMVQQQNFDNLRRLEDDVSFLKGLLEKKAPNIFIEALGLFEDTDRSCKEMALLRHRVSATLGKDFIRRQMQKVAEEAQGLKVFEGIRPDSPSDKRLARPVSSVSERESELLAMYMGLSVLKGAIPIRLDLLHDVAPLVPGFEPLLKRLSKRIERSVLRLLESKRPDRGLALLVEMARYQAIKKSLSSNRLLVLDVFDKDSPAVSFKHYENDLDGLRLLLERLGKDVIDAQRAAVLESNLDEVRYSVLENLGSRFFELKNGLEKRCAIRIMDHQSIPRRGRTVQIPWSIDVSDKDKMVKAAKMACKHYKKEMKRLYYYNLLTRNCVTRLVDALNDCRAETGLMFPHAVPVPFIYFHSWRTSMDVSKTVFYPGYRSRQLKKLYECEYPLLVYLREFNTISSRLYRPHPSDTAFILFTDDVLFVRPVYGLINGLYGATNMALGLATAPFDRGARFFQGFWGLIYSMPELFLSNIRKGSFVWTESR